MGWDGWDLSQTTTIIRAPLAVLTINQSNYFTVVGARDAFASKYQTTREWGVALRASDTALKSLSY